MKRFKSVSTIGSISNPIIELLETISDLMFMCEINQINVPWDWEDPRMKKLLEIKGCLYPHNLKIQDLQDIIDRYILRIKEHSNNTEELLRQIRNI